MLREFWASAPLSYKLIVFSAMGLIALGLVLSLVGNGVPGREGLAVASLPVIGLGLALHTVGRVVRGQKIRKGFKR